MTPQEPPTEPRIVLGDIATSWRTLHDPLRFVMTYGPAVRAYLLAILRDEHAAEEVLQDLLVQVTERGFRTADPDRGRFRDYLKAVVRNAARRHLRRRTAMPVAGGTELDLLPGDEGDGAERALRDEWRRCVLDQAWRALDRHQRSSPGNLGYTVLRLTADHPDADSRELAAKASEQSGQPLTAEAFRKQLSRARRLFAELIAAEVRQTLDGATDQQVRDELADLGLLEFLRDYLPAAGP
jgi:RNA polymerase sigma-70 factor (ECF subfamily)